MGYGADKYSEDVLIDRIRDLEDKISELEAETSSESALASKVDEYLDYYDDNIGECCEDCDAETIYYVMRQLRKAAEKVTSGT